MRVLNICNLKGGVGKTITRVNLAYVLAAVHQMRVLIIDNDKQGNTSKFFGVHSYDHPSIADIMTGDKTAEEVIRKTALTGIDCIPANMKLLEANKIVMMDTMRPQQKRLETALRPVMAQYDFGIIDNAPDENMSVINALTVGDDVMIPVKVDRFTFDGVNEMLQCIEIVRSNFNPLLKFRGCVLTSYRRNEVNEQGAAYLQQMEKYQLMNTRIHWTAKIDESTFAAAPIMQHSPRCRATRGYMELAREYLTRIGIPVHRDKEEG